MPLRVQLRDVRDDDLPTLFEHQMDPEANRMANFDARDRDAFMAHWAKILADETLLARTVVHGGAIVGNVVSGMERRNEPTARDVAGAATRPLRPTWGVSGVPDSQRGHTVRRGLRSGAAP